MFNWYGFHCYLFYSAWVCSGFCLCSVGVILSAGIFELLLCVFDCFLR